MFCVRVFTFALFLSLSTGSMVAASSIEALPAVPDGISAEGFRSIRSIAIMHGGRFKPFESFSREILSLLTGSPTVARQEPVATVLSIAANPSDWVEARILSVPYRPLRSAIGIPEKQSYVSYNELVETKKLMRMLPEIVGKQQNDEKLSILENETMDLFNRFTMFTRVMQQDFPIVPSSNAMVVEWQPVLKTSIAPLWISLIDTFREGDQSAFMVKIVELKQTLRQVNPSVYPEDWRINLEITYHRIKPFVAARSLYGLSALLILIGLMGSRKLIYRTGFGFCIAAACIHTTGILIRVVVGGRPPVSNFFETMLWIPLVAVVIALIFERIYHAGYFVLSASMLAGITLLLADVVPLDPSIGPVVAVLRSNLWLTIHVLTIVASYGALALAAVLAHIYASAYVSGRARTKTLKSMGLFMYRTIQVGIVLLASGIMLGAVWANASWGRYWGWDPKETWSLITLLWFIAVLHGRFAGWLKDISVALSIIGGFFLLLMTYYGVSFYLVGLHSYAGANAKPVPPLLIGYFIAEVVFIAAVSMIAMNRRKLA